MNLTPTHRKLLRVLRDHAWHHGSELAAAAGRRFAAAIHQLRTDPELGLLVFEKRPSGHGSSFDWEWRLVEKDQPSLFDPLWRSCHAQD